VPITGRNSFSSCLLSRRRATECNYLDGMHHLHHGLMYLLPGAARIFARRKRQINGQIQQITVGCVLAHSTPARPFHETAILSRARGSISTGILPQRPNCRNPNSLGLMLASRLWPLCRNMSRSCISARCFRQITAPVTVRNFFLLPKFHLPGS